MKLTKIKLSILVLLFFLLFSESSFACIPNISFIKAKSLKGKVVGEGDNFPIPKAIVQVYKMKENGEEILAETKTDENGIFEINNFPSGKYLIRSKAEYFAYSYAEIKLEKSSSNIKKEDIIFTLVPETDCSGDVEVKKIEKVNKKQMAKLVKAEFLHAWND